MSHLCTKLGVQWMNYWSIFINVIPTPMFINHNICKFMHALHAYYKNYRIFISTLSTERFFNKGHTTQPTGNLVAWQITLAYLLTLSYLLYVISLSLVWPASEEGFREYLCDIQPIMPLYIYHRCILVNQRLASSDLSLTYSPSSPNVCMFFCQNMLFEESTPART